MLEDGSTFILPHGVIGVGAGYCFVIGRPLEDPSDGSVGEREAADACLACHLELHLLGRRVPYRTLLNERTATADLGLDVIHVLGPRVMDWHSVDLSSASVHVGLDGNTVARGRGADTLGSPIGAVAWVARWLGARLSNEFTWWDERRSLGRRVRPLWPQCLAFASLRRLWAVQIIAHSPRT